MPYEICPECHLMTYSARLRLLVDDECPRCGTRLDRAVALREQPTTRRMIDRCRHALGTLAGQHARPPL